MEKDRNELVYTYLGFIIKHFDLRSETIDSLKEKLDYSFETNERIVFKKNSSSHGNEITDVLNRHAHKRIINVLKKYADSAVLGQYMQEEGYKYESSYYETTLGNIIAEKFIIYPSCDNETVHNQIRRSSRYDSWEFEDVDGNMGYKIAYN